jgi:hypothetical protein
MNSKKTYTMVFLSLLFSACNSVDNAPQVKLSQQQATHSTIANSIKSKAVENINSGSIPINVKAKTTTIVKRDGGLEYIEKPIVLEEGMFHIKEFMKTLNPTLNGTLAQDRSGVVAMGACQSMASKMVSDYNNITPNVTIRRTALKYRNPNNKPDKVDTEVMYQLESDKSFKPVAVDMGNTYRVYKPIRVEAKCIVCHGSKDQISPKVLQMINKKYPKDMATGFRVGDFRGAVVAEFPKNH